MLRSPEVVFAAAPKARESVSALDRVAFDWRLRWLTQAHAHQIEPEGDWWTTWLLLAGRGAGKTRCAAEWIAWEAWSNPGSRSLVSAPTAADVRDTCFEGESGLLAVVPEELRGEYNRSLSEIVLRNGSLIKGISAAEPERFRGGQWHRVWADELAAWVYDADALDMIMFALRLGNNPRLVATTTPKPRDLIRGLVARNGKDVAVTRATTMSNLANLAPTFRDQIMQYEGTELFRQEALGELIDPEESGIIKRSWFRLWPAKQPLPAFNWIVMSLDTAFTEATYDRKSGADYTACTVWGGFNIKTKTPAGVEDERAHVLLLDCWAEHYGLPELIKRVKKEMNVAYGDDHDVAMVRPLIGAVKPRMSGRKVDMLIIENKGSGISLRQMLDREGILSHPYNPGGADKLARLHIVSPIFARKQVWLPESDKFPGKPRTWVEPMLAQVCSFTGAGSTKHDDYVDSVSQALRLLVDKGMLSAVHKKADDVREPVAPRTIVNPYAA